MSVSIKKLWNEYGVGGILLAIIVLYVLYMLYKYFMSKGKSGSEKMSSNTQNVYNKPSNNKPRQQSTGPQPSEDTVASGNEVFSSVGGMQTTGQGIPSACNKPNAQNPADLLPKDNNSQWAQLNPAGKGDLANINLLKAGYHIGIDTVGQTLRNANLQIRSEPPNPQVNVGPWNLSTIEPDFMRPPLEVGQGGQ
jgi:hypothetical protein